MRRLGRAGFTLTELLVSLGLLSVVLTSVMAVVVNMQRGYVRQRESARTEDALRAAESAIITILRTAESNPRGITGFNAPRILADPLGHSKFDNLRVVSDFNPPDGDVADQLEDVLVSIANDTLYIRWQAGAGNLPVAYPVRTLTFEYYTAAGTVPLTAAQIATARRVRFILTAPRHSRTTALARRETWVYLRNRR
jgi:prepilin-type N-terminal cleavage/methylation domain-containing protein